MTAPANMIRSRHADTLRRAAKLGSSLAPLLFSAAQAIASMEEPITRASDVEQWRWSQTTNELVALADALLDGAS